MHDLRPFLCLESGAKVVLLEHCDVRGRKRILSLPRDQNCDVRNE